MPLVNPLHWYHRPAHLERVIAEMRRRGAPVIRASWDDAAGVWHAHEGTHRLRAAAHLGLAPVLVPVPWRRSNAGRVRARYAARRNAHFFEKVVIRNEAAGTS